MAVALAPHEQQPQGIDLVEGDVVAGHDAELGSRAQRSGDPLVQQLEAGLGDEGGDDGDVRRGREDGPEVLAQRVVVAAGREWRLARCTEAGDDGDVSVGRRVFGGASRRERDFVAVGVELLVEAAFMSSTRAQRAAFSSRVASK
jgi:hypothetical protein